MDEDARWARAAALGGVVFVVLNVIGALLPGAPPSADDSAAKVTKYFTDNGGRIQAAQVLGGIGVIGLLWWFGTLWRLMSAAEGARPRLAMVATVALAVGASMALLNGAVLSATALRIENVGDGSRFFLVLSSVALSTAGFGILAFVAAVAALNYRRPFLPRWLTYVGWVVALGFLIASFGAASDADAFVIAGLLSFLLWCVWILGISAAMWRGTTVTD